MDYGIQMYSVRDITGKDLRGALKRIAQIGYRYVEFAGFFGAPASEVKEWLSEYGLKISGTHTGLRELEQDIDGVIRYHKELGNPCIIIPGHDLSSQSKLDDFIEKVNAFQPILAKEGIGLGFHNHSSEFLPNRDGSMVHEQLVFTDGRPAQVAVVDKEVLTVLHTGYRPGLREQKQQRNQAQGRLPRRRRHAPWLRSGAA